MRRIGHRGAVGHAREDAPASFEAAIALGCDGVETDVWLASDGPLVIAHDPPAPGVTHLSLDEVLDLCRGRVAVNVELKCESDEARARAAGAPAASRITRREDPSVYVSSFWWAALEAARDAAPAVRRAFIFSDAPERAALIAGARALGLWALHPNRAYVTRELVEAAHAASLPVNVWAANDPADIPPIPAPGVDGVLSHLPE